MKNILIYGSNSFIAKNFVIKYENYYNIYCYKKYFKNQKKFSSSLFKYIKRNKIKYLINFAANNDNSKKNENFIGFQVFPLFFFLENFLLN